MTSASRQVVQAAYYEPFGRVRGVSTVSGLVTSEPASYLNNRTYTGQYRESATAMGSLMHYNARQYSPYLGRMLSADAIVPQPGNPQALNRLSYVYNSPTNHTDPTGHCIWDLCLVEISLLVVAAVALVVIVVWQSYEVTVGPNAAEYRSNFDELGRDIESAISPPAQVSTLRGLTSSEQERIDKVWNIDWEIPRHSDLASDAEAVLRGLGQSGNNSNHVEEARGWARGLDNAQRTLERWLNNRNLTEEARRAIQEALDNARANRQLLRELLGDVDIDEMSEEDFQRLLREGPPGGDDGTDE